MTPKDPDKADLARTAADYLGTGPEAVELTRCSTGKYNSTWFVDHEGGRLVLRVAPEDRRELNLFYEHRMMRQEPGIHSRLAELTSVPVPGILHYDFGRRLLDRDYLVMEMAPGTPLSNMTGISGRAYDRLLSETGEALRQAHSIRGGDHGYAGEHRPMEPRGRWNDAFGIMWNMLLDDIEGCEGYSAEEAGAMRRLLDDNMEHFGHQPPACLLHMDVWAQNMLTDSGGRLTGLLDWDRALWGDPEIEFAVLDYTGVSEPAFWEGYGSERDMSPPARVRQVFYLLYEVQKYIFIRRVRNNNPSLADSYRSQSLRMASSLGLRL